MIRRLQVWLLVVPIPLSGNYVRQVVHMHCCNSLMYGISDNLLEKSQVIQNASAPQIRALASDSSLCTTLHALQITLIDWLIERVWWPEPGSSTISLWCYANSTVCPSANVRGSTWWRPRSRACVCEMGQFLRQQITFYNCCVLTVTLVYTLRAQKVFSLFKVFK